MSNYVLTPGGYRPSEQVHLASASEFSLHFDGNLVLEDERGRRRNLATRSGARPSDQPSMPRNVRPAPPGPDFLAATLGSGWITYAGWTATDGDPVVRFSARWIVPPPPAESVGQTIFLFTGLQSSDWILQPVLQWGVSAAGGGPYWSIAGWYVDGKDGPAIHSPLTTVQSGAALEGVMTGVARGAAGFDYVAEFSGFPSTRRTVHAVDELRWCNVTLEAYKPASRDSYPRADSTTFSSIELQCATGAADVRWADTNAIQDVGQRCDLSPDPVNGPDITLSY